MNKIKWKLYRPTGDMTAQIGNVYLDCLRYQKSNSVEYLFSPHCRAGVTIRRIAHTQRFGPWRKSMARAKEDAVRIARELLEDYRVAVDREMEILLGVTGENNE